MTTEGAAFGGAAAAGSGKSAPSGLLCPLRKRDARSSSERHSRQRALQDRRDRTGARQRGISAIRSQCCQPSPSFRFKVLMSGSNALLPLALFWE